MNEKGDSGQNWYKQYVLGLAWKTGASHSLTRLAPAPVLDWGMST